MAGGGAGGLSIVAEAFIVVKVEVAIVGGLIVGRAAVFVFVALPLLPLFWRSNGG